MSNVINVDFGSKRSKQEIRNIRCGLIALNAALIHFMMLEDSKLRDELKFYAARALMCCENALGIESD